MAGSEDRTRPPCDGNSCTHVRRMFQACRTYVVRTVHIRYRKVYCATIYCCRLIDTYSLGHLTTERELGAMTNEGLNKRTPVTNIEYKARLVGLQV
jgi:hypothetical protein